MNIEKTNTTPEIKFENGVLEISGRSIPKHALEFFNPLKKTVEEYSLNPLPKTTVKVTLDYFNTPTAKILLDIFKMLERLHKAGEKSGKEVKIEWYFEEDDEEMLEYGEDYEQIINVPFSFHEIEE